MEVRHGTLLNVFGTPARGDGFTIVPAFVELGSIAHRLDHQLSERFGAHAPRILRYPVDQGFDAAWVRARIPNVFGFTPEPAEVEKALLYLGFVAITETTEICYPFICTDHYGRSALMFNDDGPEEGVKRSIADAFWGVLAQEPDDVADFEERVYHPGAGLWLRYGSASGYIYCEESEDE